jgi:hypothetical protein
MKKVMVVLGLALSMSSCMINTHVIGEGAKSEEVVKKKTFYILGNRISEVDSKALAGDATNYEIDTRANFVDMLINGFTFGIVGSRTVTIKK